MGAGMDKVLPGLYIGSLRDSKDKEQLERNQISHILSIHDDAKEGYDKSITYLCIKASDCASQDIQQYFQECIEFIHKARLNGGNVLVHCLAGVSRSTTIVIAYVMTVTELSWVDAMNAVRGARKVTNPNFGFQRQLQSYEHTRLRTEKERLEKLYGKLDLYDDADNCKKMLEEYHEKQQLHLTSNPSSSTESANNSNSDTHVIPKGIVDSQVNKIYPLPYNAYNVDQNMDKKFKLMKNLLESITNKGEQKANEDVLLQQEAETTTATNNDVKEDEKVFSKLEDSLNHLAIETNSDGSPDISATQPHHDPLINKFFDKS